jgi:hypothetical protein
LAFLPPGQLDLRMRESGWEEMLAEFRALGGTADNICLRDGPLGRGLFPVDPARPVAIHIPDTLLMATGDARFENGTFHVAPEAKFGARERAFLEAYENGFSWGGGGRAETRRIFEQAQAMPAELRARLMSEYHCGDWFTDPTDALVQERFIAARCIRYRDRDVVMPIVELANHGPGATYLTQDGVGIRAAFPGEVLIQYASFDPHGMFMIFGFATEQAQAFSIALGGKVGRNPVQIGRDLGNLSSTAQYWVPQHLIAGGTAKLQFLMIGNRQVPTSCRSVFYKIMREIGLSGFEEAFDTIRHANRLHFLALLAAVEAVEGPMAQSLRRMARFQLQAMSYCYGVSAV